MATPGELPRSLWRSDPPIWTAARRQRALAQTDGYLARPESDGVI
jgi:hypothetical protein